jgi:glycosyltransferase involved in cell wall biosynthesis
VLPARNEDRFIAMAINSIRKLDYPQDRVEIIVVDNGSTDRTVEIAAQAGVKVLTKLNCRVGAVRNEGAKNTSGEMLAFLDADCEAGPLWLRKAVEFLNAGAGAVGGIYLTPDTATWVEKAWAPTREAVLAEVDFLACSGLVVSREVFTRLNGFSEVLEAAEDDEFSRSVRNLGLKVLSVPECAVVHHGYPRKLMAIARRQAWHGTNQLESSRGLFDQLLILVHLFLLGVVASAVGLITQSPVFIEGLILSLVVVGLATLGRLYRNRYQGIGLKLFFQVYIVLLFYFGGRAVGLVKNYWKLLAKRLA